LITGKPLSILQKLNKKSNLNKHKIIQFAIAPQSREILKKTLEDRFLDMLDKGLIQEVEALINIKGIRKDLPSMRSVGYKQVWEYLDGNLSKDEMILSSISATRQLAKRQLTWLKNWKDLIWIPQNVSEALQFIIKSLDSKKLL
jgi:tRNA dimethylallyltransferase